MSHCQTYAFFHKSCSIPKQCLHNMSSNQIACLFPGTHKLFHEPLFNILTPLLFTPSVFLQMVVFSFHKSIFDILSPLSLATYFVVSDIMSYLPVLKQVPFSFKLMMVISRTSANWSKSLELPNLTGLRFSNSCE